MSGRIDYTKPSTYTVELQNRNSGESEFLCVFAYSWGAALEEFRPEFPRNEWRITGIARNGNVRYSGN